jgi:hypothetical protein
MVDTREPPNGDFVAYVEKLERDQLARAMPPHRRQSTAAGGKASDTAESKGRALSAAEAQRIVQALKARTAKDSAPRGALIGLFIGAAAIVFGLATEGGFFFVILGAVLVWHNLRKLLKGAQPATGAAQQVAQAFGQAPGPARKREQ